MTKKPKRPRDVNQLAKMMVDIASGSQKPDKQPRRKTLKGKAKSVPKKG
jgi:hypothetical protein